LPETKHVPVRVPHRELLHAVRLDYRRVHHLRDWMIDEKTCGTDNGIVTSDLCITP